MQHQIISGVRVLNGFLSVLVVVLTGILLAVAGAIILSFFGFL